MRLFEILDQLNQLDGESKTPVPFVGICPDMTAANMYTNHGDVKFGVPVEVARHLVLSPNRFKAIMLIIDMDEYNKINPKP